MTTTEVSAPSASGVIKCPCGTRFHKDQRHTCDFYDNSSTTIDALERPTDRSVPTRPSDFTDPPENRGGKGTGHRPDTRTNRFPGTCIKCGGRVEAEAGNLVRDNSKTGGSPWGVEHKIGECLAEPVKASEPTTSSPTMSPAQEGFLRSLIARKTPDANADGIIETINGLPNPKGGASAMIDSYKSMPDAPKPKAQVEVDTERRGDVHMVDGQYYRVHVAQRSGNLYACVWDEELESFEYVPRMMGKLNDGNKVTAEQAAAFGKMYGRCCFCSTPIDTPESTGVGYGPVCAEKRGLPWG